MTGDLPELRNAIADLLAQLPGDYTWAASVRYVESGVTEVGWGFDVDRPPTRPLTIWFDIPSQLLRLQVPETFIRHRGLSVVWNELSDPEMVCNEVLAHLRQQLPLA